jgi:protein O-GlcNAc transferase
MSAQDALITAAHACLQGGDETAAEGLLRQILAEDPAHAEATLILGGLMRRQGDLKGAAILLLLGSRQHPGRAEFHVNLGNTLADMGRLAQAEAEYRQALAQDGDCGEAHAGLALLMEARGAREPALFHHFRATEILPRSAEARFNLGTALEGAGRYGEAEAAYRRALALREAFPAAWNNLGNLLQETGRVLEADSCFRRALQLAPGFAIAHSSLLMNLHYRTDLEPEAIWAEHLDWAKRHAPAPRTGHANRRDPARPLKVGYLAAYYRNHPAGFLTEAALSRHDPAQVEFFVYVNNAGEDGAAERLRAFAAGWRAIGDLGDEEAADLIQADGIDILVDLAGHTRDHRLGLVALKPAPLVLHWGAAYWNTTGLAQLDGLITDRIEVPPEAPPPLAERPLYLPNSYVCYRPPGDPPALAPPPLLERGHPTFGSFNRVAKLNDLVLDLWGRLLAQSPQARLVLQDRSFSDGDCQGRMLARLAGRGIEAGRVTLLGRLSHSEVLEAYGQIDVALDTFPWSGSIITCEALLMGVPVVTLPGRTIAARHSASYLTTLGRPEWIAASGEDYIAKALELVASPQALAGLRAGLREELLASPLSAGEAFARNLESLYRNLWRTWCQTRPE